MYAHIKPWRAAAIALARGLALCQAPEQRAKLKVFVDPAELKALPLRATP